MNKSVVIVAIVAVLAIGGVLVVTMQDDTNENNTTEQTPSTSQNADEQDAGTELETDQAPAAAESSVVIEDFAFKQATITVKKGTKVTWTNKDSVSHTVTPDETSNDFQGSELLGKGQSYSYTFSKTGTFKYHCQPHPQMTGTVIVVE